MTTTTYDPVEDLHAAPIPAALRKAAWAAPCWVLYHPDGSPYLTRWVLWGVDALENHDPACLSSGFLHHIHTADGDRHPHNHPWAWASTVILAGGYEEERCSSQNTRRWVESHRVGDDSRFFLSNYHRILRVEPSTWTLFTCGKEVQDWGFRVDDRHVPHAEYFARDDVQQMTHRRVFP